MSGRQAVGIGSYDKMIITAISISRWYRHDHSQPHARNCVRVFVFALRSRSRRKAATLGNHMPASDKYLRDSWVHIRHASIACYACACAIHTLMYACVRMRRVKSKKRKNIASAHPRYLWEMLVHDRRCATALYQALLSANEARVRDSKLYALCMQSHAGVRGGLSTLS